MHDVLLDMMPLSWMARRVLAVLILGALAYPASPLCQEPTKPVPIDVRDKTTQSISISQTQSYIRLPTGIKLPSGGFKQPCTTRLGELGYSLADAEVRMSLTSELMAFECRAKERSRTVKVCGIGVRWRLLDTRREGVVYEVVTRAMREIVTDSAVVQEEVTALFIGALDSLLARDAFVAAMADTTRSPAPASGDAATSSLPALFSRCKTAKLSLPKDIDNAMDATIVVRHGNVVGSAFYISEDGLALTAEHVVAGVEHVKVKDHFGNDFNATVLRRDDEYDVAIIKVDTPSNKCLDIQTVLPKVGEELYAIGSPGGEELAFTVSRGIVSGVRKWKHKRFIQTDASVNAGNSGGPLLNKQGMALGIASWKIVLPGVEGLSFGVPLESALNALALGPGTRTTLDSAAASPSAPVETYVDAPDPPFDALAVTATSQRDLPASTRSFKERYLYNGGRKALLIISPILMFGGTIAGLTSTLLYTLENSGGFGSSDDDREKRLLVATIAGWSTALTGTIMLVTFFATPRKKIEISAGPNRPGSAGGSGFSLRLGVALSGAGWALTGAF